MKINNCCIAVFFLLFFNISWSQSITSDYNLTKSRDVNILTKSNVTANGNQDFVTTIHGNKLLELYFETYKIPEGSLLKIFNGNDTLAELIGTFGSTDKIWNIKAKDITIQHISATNNTTQVLNLRGVAQEIPEPAEGGGGRSQPASDCVGAIPLCQNLTAVALAGQYTDLGAVTDDSGGCYSGTGSGGSVWYSFQPQTNGPLDFTISPSGSTDYDFVVWDITAGCGNGQRTEVSCNFSVFTGNTGLSSINCSEAGGSCTSNDCSTDSKGSDCNRFNRRPNVLTTRKYAVCINFFGGSNDGFNIQFKNEASSVNITDITPPTIINASANACPTASQFNLRFSEYVDCSAVQASDFTLPGRTITLVNTNCANGTTNNVDITITPALTSGTYSLQAINILDLCGNNMNSSFSIVVGAIPNPTISPNQSTCKSPGFLGIGFTYTPASHTLTAGGGSFYQWSDGQVGSSISVSPTATTVYTVTVTQGVCPATASVTVNVQTAPVIAIPNQNFCPGETKTLTATGGGTYQWYTNPTFFGNGTAIPAPAGTNASLTVSPTATTTYRVIVTIAGGCVGQDDVTLTLVNTNCCNASITPAGPYCNTDGDKTLVAGTSGGTWSGTGITNATTGIFSPAVSGIGSFKVYYQLACGGLDSTTIVVQVCTALSVCREINGNVTVSGGIAPYSWQRQTTTTDCSGCPFGGCNFLCAGVQVTAWTTFATTATTAPGTFPIRVRDNLGAIINITSLASLTACSAPCPTLTVNPSSIVAVRCNGQLNGSFSATTTGGASPYDYVLLNGAITVATFNNVAGAQSFTGLAAGTYTLNVTDNNNCTGTSSIIITQPVVLAVTIPTSTNASCGLNNGAATTVVTGGTSAFTYTWNNSGGATSGLTNVGANTYNVTVTDANLCTATASIVIGNSVGLTLAIVATNIGCGNPTGKAKVSSSTGTAPFTFIWSNSTTTDSIINLTAGTYQVTVTDANSCTASAATTITSGGTPPNLSIAAPGTLTCANTSSTLTASSTTAGTTFAWSGGVTGANNTVNAPATYTVTATEPGGCTASASVAVAQNITTPNVSAGADQVLSCITSVATLTGTSSTSGATYQWSGPGTVSGGGVTASGTVNVTGTYTLVVTNPSNGCTASDAVSVTPNISTPNINAGADQNLTCLVTTINLTATSSTPNVTFAWSNGANTASTSVTTANTYTVTVTDGSNGCIAIDQVTVADSTTPPNANAGLDRQLTCVISSVNLLGSSTTSGVAYAWSNGTLAASNTVNAASTYTLTVANTSNGCTASDQVIVSANTTIPTANAGSDGQLTCTITSLTLTATSSSSNASFIWSNGIFTAANTVTTPNTYSVTVTDTINGCTATDQAIITTSPGTVTADAGTDETLTCAITTVTLTATSNSANVSYTWSNGTNTANNAVTTANTYTVTVTDLLNGCSATDQVTVLANTTAPNVNAGPDQTLPCGVASVTLTGSSTTVSVLYAWSNGIATATNDVSTPNTYTLTVTDLANGCTAQDQAIVTSNVNAPDINVGADAQLTCTITTLSLTAISSISSLTYAWSTAEVTQSITVNSAATYSVTVTNTSNNCTATDEVIITSTGVPISTAQLIGNPCPETALGAITANVTGGTAPYTFIWSTGVTGASLTGLRGGLYTVTISDANGCSLSQTYNVLEGTGLQLDALAPTEILLGESVQINTSVTGAQGTVLYSWNPTINLDCSDCSSPLASPAASITYNVLVTDSNNCSDTASVRIIVTPDYSLYIPNAFTPNGDGNNDLWEIFGNKKNWKEMSITIFNRWGEKIFESNNLNFKWDGTYKGALQNPQVFVYQFKVTFIDGYLSPLKKGSFSLVR